VSVDVVGVDPAARDGLFDDDRAQVREAQGREAAAALGDGGPDS
jgi:hypothetical protein